MEPNTSKTRQNASSVAPSHTPGPWKISGPYHDGDGDEPGQVMAARLLGYDGERLREVIGDFCGERETMPSYDANLRLIAAAPELLEAVKLVFAEMQEQYVPGENCDCSTDARNCEWCATYRKLESAISKAERP